VAEAAAAAAAAAAANASAAKSVTVKDLDVAGASSNRLQISAEPVLGIKVQSQGGAMVIASDVKPAVAPAVVSSAAEPQAAASAVKAGVELVLSSASAPMTPPVATGSVAVSDAAFVQVKSFQPLPVPAGSSFSFTLPGDAFVHKDPQMAVEVSAQTPTGDPLPEWLSFSAADRRFTGVAPQGVTQIEVVVKAVDASGAEATTVITLQFDAPPSQ
jgi:hypothetical protein